MSEANDLSLADIVGLPPTAPWAEGDNIPWDEPGFSGRMLREHLSQQHDAASRRDAIIGAQVDWIHRMILHERPVKILDLGCGPGLYTSALTRRGHACTGIDYSPASIAHAIKVAKREGLACSYTLGDIRTTDYGQGFELVMLTYGEFNVFSPGDARAILRKAHAALANGSVLLLEPHTYDAVRAKGTRGRSWYPANSGLFSGRPHLCLQEHFWDDASETATIRYAVVDAATAVVRIYAQTFQAYSPEEYATVLSDCGFAEIEAHRSLTGVEGEGDVGLIAIVARKA